MSDHIPRKDVKLPPTIGEAKLMVRIEELEAKLARAVEALERIASGEFSGRMLTSMPPQDAAQYFARTTLAELKEEDRG